MVTREQIWDALDEIPDPEIPVISLVELGVVRDVAVDGSRVSVTLTPTFLGCPALDAMRRSLEAAITGLGAEPAVVIERGDAWTSDRITPAGREKLRAAGLAPPAPAGGQGAAARAAPVEGVPVPVLRLDRDPSREHLRADALPLAALLRKLQAAVRAVQDDLTVSKRESRKRRSALAGASFRTSGSRSAQ